MRFSLNGGLGLGFFLGLGAWKSRKVGDSLSSGSSPGPFATQTCSALINVEGVMAMARGYQMTSSGHAIKNANVSIQCEFYANGKVKSKIRAARSGNAIKNLTHHHFSIKSTNFI